MKMWLLSSLGLTLTLGLVGFTQAMFRDEAGQHDWHLEMFGRLSAVRRVSAGRDSLICVASEAAVLGCMEPSTGAVVWRGVLDSSDTVDALEPLGSDRLASVSGGGSMVRVWNAKTGDLMWEGATEKAPRLNGATALLDSPTCTLVLAHDMIHCFSPSSGTLKWTWNGGSEGLRLHDFQMQGESIVVSGVGSKGVVAVELSQSGLGLGSIRSAGLGRGSSTSFLAAVPGESWIACGFSGREFATLDAMTGTAVSIDLKPVLAGEQLSAIAVVPGTGGSLLEVRGASGGGAIISLSASLEATVLIRCAEVLESSCALGGSRGPSGLLAAAFSPGHPTRVGIEQSGSVTVREIPHLRWAEDMVRGKVRHVFPIMLPGEIFSLTVYEDDSIVGEGSAQVRWVREEALTGIQSVGFVDLEEMGRSSPRDHRVPSYAERLVMHMQNGLQGLRSVVMGPSPSALRQDDAGKFGLGKLAIVTTSVGKLCALNLVNGRLRWAKMFRDEADSDAIFITRPRPVLGYASEFVLVRRDRSKGLSLTWYEALSGQQTLQLIVPDGSYVTPLDMYDNEDRQMLMVITKSGKVVPAPDSASGREVLNRHLPHVFHYNVNEKGLQSFSVQSGPAGLDSVQVGSALWGAEETVVSVAHVDPLEAVASPAHILGDDSLLLKYLNPHLLAVATLSPAGGGEGSRLTITLVDAVSAKLLHRVTHHQAAAPVHCIVSENNVVYSYWSAKARRTEVGSVALFEGVIDKWGLSPLRQPEWRPAFSSFDAHAPIAIQKTFALPHAIHGMSATRTARGITSKQVLVALPHGQVAAIDRRWLDPRRPSAEPTKLEKEERLLQYAPFLPVNRLTMPTYSRGVERVTHMACAPTHLESTAVLLAYGGLDIYSGRLTPSKPYDLLAQNFNYFLLILVLCGMLIMNLMGNYYARRKRLAAMWQ